MQETSLPPNRMNTDFSPRSRESVIKGLDLICKQVEAIFFYCNWNWSANRPRKFTKSCFINADWNHDVFVFCSPLQFCCAASKDNSEIRRLRVPW